MSFWLHPLRYAFVSILVIRALVVLVIIFPLATEADGIQLSCKDVMYSDYSDNLYNVYLGDARLKIEESDVLVTSFLLKIDGVYQATGKNEIYIEAILGAETTVPQILHLDRNNGGLTIIKKLNSCQLDWMIEAFCTPN